ncbi:hypothetical protein B9Z55_004584 [Caenorhabditis nigoni]|uniref:PLOD1-3-like GT domain-containing protein n=1 Tax=Caenorhabditis nigoni TaxID=1611254 RepID=A0A2G5UX27_9PELO|nr:hypothetical protein B9Z55_004584 [Caenorhabditis nigoni]
MRVLPLLPILLIPAIFAVSITDLPELVVVTVATDNTDGLKRLLESAKAFDINIEVLGLGEKWNGGDTRVEQVNWGMISTYDLVEQKTPCNYVKKPIF